MGHPLDFMTVEERTAYFVRREEAMKASHLVERFRLWCHPVHDLFFWSGIFLFLTWYGTPIGILLINLSIWIRTNNRIAGSMFLTLIPAMVAVTVIRLLTI